jgi:hypothetical protein
VSVSSLIMPTISPIVFFPFSLNWDTFIYFSILVPMPKPRLVPSVLSHRVASCQIHSSGDDLSVCEPESHPISERKHLSIVALQKSFKGRPSLCECRPIPLLEIDAESASQRDKRSTNFSHLSWADDKWLLACTQAHRRSPSWNHCRGIRSARKSPSETDNYTVHRDLFSLSVRYSPSLSCVIRSLFPDLRVENPMVHAYPPILLGECSISFLWKYYFLFSMSFDLVLCKCLVSERQCSPVPMRP